MRKHIIVFIILTLTVFVTYRHLQNLYFEQDEWHTFARFLTVQQKGSEEFIRASLLSGPLVHFTPFSFLTKYTLFNFFGLNPQGYLLTSIIFHLFVTLVLYIYLFILSKDILLSLFCAVFFAVNSSHLQAVSWIGTFEGTEAVAFFGVLYLIFSIFYDKYKKWKYILVSSFMLLIALLFKETAISFFILGCLLLLIEKLNIYKSNFNKKRWKTKLLSMVIVALVYIFFRYNYLFLNIDPYQNPIASFQSFNIKYLIYNSVTLVPKVLSSDIVPQASLINISMYLTNILSEINRFTIWIWTDTSFIIYDFLGGVLGMVCIIFILFNLRKGKLFLLSMLIFISATIPLLVLRSPLIFLDGRQYYLMTIGVVVFFVAVIKQFPFKRIFFIELLTILIVWHIGTIWKNIDKQTQTGKVRKNILSTIMISYPKIPDKVIFYVISDAPYYGLIENIPPFQSGFGQTLLVNYNYLGQLSTNFYNDDFLWEIKSQGYKEAENRGFGYFRDLDLLKKAIIEYNLPQESVVAFKWISEENKLVDITNEIRTNLYDQEVK